MHKGSRTSIKMGQIYIKKSTQMVLQAVGMIEKYSECTSSVTLCLID